MKKILVKRLLVLFLILSMAVTVFSVKPAKKLQGKAILFDWYADYKINGTNTDYTKDIDGIARDIDSYHFGALIWFAKQRSGTTVLTSGVSIGYRAYRYNNGKRENGFVTCAHGLKDSPEKYVYADSLRRKCIGTVRQTVYSGSCDAAFVVLLNNISLTGKGVYRNASIVVDISSDIALVNVGDRVCMVGASSGFVGNKKVISTNATMDIKGRDGKNFISLIKTEKMTKPGDSGAPVFKYANGKYKIVGIIKGHDGSGTYVVRESSIAQKLGAHPY